MVLLPSLACAQQVHLLLGWHDEGSSHGHGHCKSRFHSHANVVPATPVRFKGEIFSLFLLVVDFKKGRRVRRIRGNVLPVYHFLDGLFGWSAVGFAIQSCQFHQRIAFVVVGCFCVWIIHFSNEFFDALVISEIFHGLTKGHSCGTSIARMALATNVTRVNTPTGHKKDIQGQTENEGNPKDGNEPIVQWCAYGFGFSTSILLAAWLGLLFFYRSGRHCDLVLFVLPSFRYCIINENPIFQKVLRYR
mmetsp:Transcript_22249/g.55099  ORF Transcript_22249/g.55099 Transcript_22249/m.55099 type:complete len:247 (-) Transcript_22249:33-773(-)